MQLFQEPVTKYLKLQKHSIDALKRLGINCNKELLLHKPNYYIHKNINPSILKNGEIVILDVIITEIIISTSRRSPSKIYVKYADKEICLIFFSNIPKWILSKLNTGLKCAIEGKVDSKNHSLQISHPEFIFNGQNKHIIEPIYPLTYGLKNKQLHNYILSTLRLADLAQSKEAKNDHFNEIENIIEALYILHSPKNEQDIKDSRIKMAYYELLANQIAVSHSRNNNIARPGNAYQISQEWHNQIMQNLAFELTDGQQEVLQEIYHDQKNQQSMIRMLQGDVGSGKTLVALLSMLNVIYSSKQAAFMAPTDLLANQHYNFFCKATKSLDIKIALLTGKTKAKERRELLADLDNGNIDILIGTHSLFQEKVIFHDLGYIVIDEQHKFGVMQRMELLAKAKNPDLLVMTATPIPRSLTMTLFGDMSVSLLKSKPKNRPQIITALKSRTKIDELISAMHTKLENNEKVYWVCALIEANEDDDNPGSDKAFIQDATSRHAELKKIFPEQVGLLHGKMSGTAKDEIMQSFKNGDIKILVSTTVIEVGIDVSDATLIIIENAERFGLAQLHQLRGRVGRGTLASHCILLYEFLAGDIKTRLTTMRESDDGFYIAEQDLKLRGSGEILGTKQSGNINFNFADLSLDLDILNKCKLRAESITSDQYQHYQWLLNLFQNDSIIQNQLA